jgi:transposase
MMTEREQRGLTIAALSKIKQKGSMWIVPSQSGEGRYKVFQHEGQPVCTCPDHEATGKACKHIFAVQFVVKRETAEDGTITDTRSITITETRKTYSQNWPAYNAAQVNEKAQFQLLLRDLLQGVEEPTNFGRPRIPLRDSLFAAVFKVYSTVSGRRFMSDLTDAHDKGYIRKLPCYNTIFNVLDSEETFGLLRALIEKSALPLKALESHFSCDSSGFSGSRFDRWYDHKWGEHRVLRAWVKAHVMCGAKTNVVTAVEIFDKDANDGVQLPALLTTTAANFDVKEVSADLAYSTKANVAAVDAINAKPLIPFKKNATDASGGLWGKLFHYFSLNREEFDRQYHKRSNIESTFSMVKAKFGDGVRSKTDMAMKNEVLAKLLCHNICCLIQSMYEFGIDPTCWADSPVAQQVT